MKRHRRDRENKRRDNAGGREEKSMPAEKIIHAALMAIYGHARIGIENNRIGFAARIPR